MHHVSNFVQHFFPPFAVVLLAHFFSFARDGLAVAVVVVVVGLLFYIRINRLFSSKAIVQHRQEKQHLPSYNAVKSQ